MHALLIFLVIGLGRSMDSRCIYVSEDGYVSSGIPTSTPSLRPPSSNHFERISAYACNNYNCYWRMSCLPRNGTIVD